MGIIENAFLGGNLNQGGGIHPDQNHDNFFEDRFNPVSELKGGNFAETILGFTNPAVMFAINSASDVLDGKNPFSANGIDGKGNGSGLGNNNVLGQNSSGATDQQQYESFRGGRDVSEGALGNSWFQNTDGGYDYNPYGNATFDANGARTYENQLDLGAKGGDLLGAITGAATQATNSYAPGAAGATTNLDSVLGTDGQGASYTQDSINADGTTSGTLGYSDGFSENITGYGDGMFSDEEGTGWEDPSFDDSSSDSGDSGGGDSYIATAATQALGEDGLTVFNNWREHLREVLPSFTTSWGRYRVTAPKIVIEINKEENPESIYKEIWDKYLKPIRKLIIDKKDDEALVDYKEMVRDLQKRFLK